MDVKALPFMYAALVFSVVAFLFILLGRIFLNVETIYFYETDVVTTVGDNYMNEIGNLIKSRGEKGWKYEGYQVQEIEGATNKIIIVIFMKSRNKIRLF